MERLDRPEVVVVTGASAGVGRAVAREFGKQGAKVGLLARGRDGLEAARAEIEALGGEALVLPADVANAEQVEAGWSYLWEGARSGGRNLFSSQVSRIGGAEGERRRLELAAVVRELLHHAEQRTQAGDGAERRA